MSRQGLCFGLAAGMAVAAPVTLEASICVPPLPNGNSCTANDLSVNLVSNSGPGACTEGSTFQATLRIGLAPNVSLRQAAQRFDIGIFVGNNGEPPIGGSDCTAASLNPVGLPVNVTSGVGPYHDFDGDACGDFLRDDPLTVKDVQVDSLLCRDEDGDGRVDVDVLVTWKGPNEPCTDPADPAEFFPDQSSKCRLDGADLPIRVEPAPSMRVVKTATPAERETPGGTVSYSVAITNTSSGGDPITVNGLTDSLHGNLNGKGTCTVGTAILPGETRKCTFDELVSGTVGDTVTDVVTVSAVDDEGALLTATAQATVTLVAVPPPIVGAIRVVKVPLPGTVLEPGGLVTMTVLIANVSPLQVVIDSLLDGIAGNLDGRGSCGLPQTLAPHPGYFLCQYKTMVTGPGGASQVSTVTASGTDALGNPLSDADSATVHILDRPSSMMVRKGANPSSLLEPGGPVTFTVAVQNTSLVDSLDLISLVDNVQGDLDAVGTCEVPQTLAPRGGVYECQFAAQVTGSGGSESTDTVTATAIDDEGNPIVELAGATVSIFSQLEVPSLHVTKTATPTTVDEPGGTVTFQITVTNTSPSKEIELQTLEDSVHGNLAGVGTCQLPQTLAAGEQYDCQFQATVSGPGGSREIDNVVAAGVDDDEEPVAAEASAEVDVADLPPEISVRKTAQPNVISPGTPVTFRIQVTNESSADSLSLVELVDDVYGNLNGRGTCSLPQTLALRGTSYFCEFTAVVQGSAPSMQIDIVTASASSTGFRSLAIAQASAIVLLVPAAIVAIPGLSAWGAAVFVLLLAGVAIWRLGAL